MIKLSGTLLNLTPIASMFQKAVFCFLIFFGISGALWSQVAVSGTVTDKDGTPLPVGNVRLLNLKKQLITGTTTDFDGKFTMDVKGDTSYIVLFSYVGFLSQYKELRLTKEPVNFGRIIMKEDPKFLEEVEVKVTQSRVEQKGDTTSFNADAFKTHQDATVEDLVKKMPGITSDNNGIKVNGETVTKVMVDGKAFFGDDATAALKNLPAEIIDKVEVFDKMSDQAVFTGFDDGEQQKTINLVTKKGKNQGLFGRVYAGAGADEDLNARYNAGGVINAFSEKRRFTFLFLGNNVNQQNFTSSDLSGVMSQQGNRGGGEGGGGRRNSNNALLAPNQNGITSTRSAGLNFSDTWNKKMEVSGSYFFNNTDNLNEGYMVRAYFTDDSLVYRQVNSDRMLNLNHRFNLRFEYQIDSSDKLTISPSLAFQNNDATSLLTGNNMIRDVNVLSNSVSRSNTFNTAYDFSNFLLYQHKFKKAGRTISFRQNTTLSERTNTGDYYSLNNYNDTDAVVLDQQFRTPSDNLRLSGNLAYTEPLSKQSQIQVSYSPSYNESKSDKRTSDFNAVANDYSSFNPSLSNSYKNFYQTQRGGLAYKYRKEKVNISIGADAQVSELKGEQTYPFAFNLNQSFRNILPNARLSYKISKAKNLRINYRSTTDIPSISQLQNVVDISNPLQVRSGNAGLQQTFDNSLNIRLAGYDAKTSRNTMVLLGANYTDNYIGNAVYVLKSDSLIQGYTVKAGSQLSKPVNMDNFYSSRLFLVYGFPAAIIKSNMNLNGGVNYNHTPGLFDNQSNFSNSYSFNGGIYAGSNISKKMDFSISYNANYTLVKNTVQTKSDNNYFTHSTTFKINWITYAGLVLNSDVTHTSYMGLSQALNQQYVLWNAGIGYKFLKNDALEARISVFDILNQNRAISRTVTGAYTEDNFTNILRRYALFTLSYTIRRFKGDKPPADIFPENSGGDVPQDQPPPRNK